VWIEAGVPPIARQPVGTRDAVVGLERFGESGPGREVADHLGLSAPAVAREAVRVIGRDPLEIEATTHA